MSVAEERFLRANVAQAPSETERREKSDIDRDFGRTRRLREARKRRRVA